MSALTTILRWGPAVAATAGALVMGSLPVVPGTGFASDKVLHFCGFGVLTVLWVRGLQGHLIPVIPRRAAGALGLGVATGILLELWQALLPWREASLGDVVADLFGAATAVVIILALGRLSRDGTASEEA